MERDDRTTQQSVTSEDRPAAAPETGTDAPVCAVHNTPMVLQPGKRGSFWSCHERTADGGFCSYRPPRE
jgi:hypothetical protein